MSANLTLFKLVVKPLTGWAAQRALVGRNRVRGEPEKGRFTNAEVSRLLDRSWRAFDELVPDVSREQTVGSRLNVRLAALTLAFWRSLSAAGIEKAYAIELVADTCWQIYQYWGYLGLLGRSLSGGRTVDPAKRVGKDGVWPIAFPFTYPGYIARYVPAEKGVAFDMVRCPVAEFFRAHGSGEVAAGTWCSLDFAMAEMGQRRLVRPHTLAAGDECCDFRWLPAGAPAARDLRGH